MKQLEDMAVVAAGACRRPLLARHERLSRGEVAALRRAFAMASVLAPAVELNLLRARLESGALSFGQRQDCLKAIGQLALGAVNEAGFEQPSNEGKK